MLDTARSAEGTPGERRLFAKGRGLIANCCPVVGWLLVAGVIALIGWSLLFANLKAQERAHAGTALREASILARAYAEHLSQSLGAIDQIALYIKYAWEYSGGAFRLEGIEESGLIPKQSGFFVAIFDGQGNFLTSIRPEAIRRNAAKEPFFLAQENARKDHFHISEIRHGQFTQRAVVQFSRSLANADGEFNGVVLVSVVPEYFIAGYDEITLGRQGFLGILGDDRSIRVTRIGKTVFNPEGQGLRSVPDTLGGSSGASMVSGAPWFADGRNRFLAWQHTDAYGMIVLAGLDQESAMAPYRERRASEIRHATWATYGLFLFAAVGMILTRRVMTKQRQLDGLRAAYRMATEGGTEAFYIFRPVFDRGQRVSDFEMVDCNHRGAELLRRRREQVIGRSLSSLYPRDLRDLAWRPLHEAFDQGLFDGEQEQPDGSPVAARWVHMRIVRSEDNLAVTCRDISDTKAHEIALRKLVNEDTLTGLPNRYWVKDFLPDAIRRARGNGKNLAVLFIDLDGFKAVNDTLGHDAGDELLRNAGRRLKLAVRPQDKVARIGGDEFVVLLEDAGDKSGIAHVAERILEAFREQFSIAQSVHSVGTSIGISVFPGDGDDADTLLRHADIAMYSVKTGGKRNYRFFDQRFYEGVRAQHEREAALRRAIDQDQFLIYYQPRIEMSTGTMSGMEALVRWKDPARGIVDPPEFIPLAEETGLIVPLGELVIDKVCAQLAAWARSGRRLLPVSVNVSARQIRETRLPEILAAALARHKLEPRLIEVELAESSMMDDKPFVFDTLGALQAMGIRLIVDDFGAGYSSLAKLQEIDFDLLKVDKAFTDRLQKSAEGQALFHAVIAMAHSLGMRVVAEGVERPEQVELLKDLHCDEVQGFVVSRPRPPQAQQPVYYNWETADVA